MASSRSLIRHQARIDRFTWRQNAESMPTRIKPKNGISTVEICRLPSTLTPKMLPLPSSSRNMDTAMTKNAKESTDRAAWARFSGSDFCSSQRVTRKKVRVLTASSGK